MLCDDSVTACLARDADRAVGVMVLNDCSAICAGGRFGEICELYVGPDDRSAGLGRHLIEAAVDYARKAGWTRLEVGAPEQPRWQRTTDFYRANGFTLVGPRLRLAIDQEAG